MDDIIEIFNQHSSIVDDKLETLQDWLEDVKSEFKEDGQSRKTSALFRFTCILRELVLSHRWQDVIHVLSQIVMEARGAQDIVHHLGFEVFLQEPALNYGLLKKLTDQVQLLAKYDTTQIILDFFMYLLSQQHFENVMAKDWTKLGTKRRSNTHQYYVKTTYRAYEGLLYYIKWCQVKSQIELSESEQISTDTESLFGHQTDDRSALADKQHLHQNKERACSCFAVCLENPGIWDVFIVKWVEMLEYHEEVDAARKVLEEYYKKHRDNPFVLSQLHNFYKRHGDSVENYCSSLDVLKALCDKVPFGQCVLELYKLCESKSEEGPLRLRLLFSLLDYPQWKENADVWQMLAKELEQIQQSPQPSDMTSTLSDVWTMRSAWWLPYHFRYSSSEERGLQCWKAVTAVYLYGKDADYVKETLHTNIIDNKQQALILSAITSSNVLPN